MNNKIILDAATRAILAQTTFQAIIIIGFLNDGPLITINVAQNISDNLPPKIKIFLEHEIAAIEKFIVRNSIEISEN